MFDCRCGSCDRLCFVEVIRLKVRHCNNVIPKYKHFFRLFLQCKASQPNTVQLLYVKTILPDPENDPDG